MVIFLVRVYCYASCKVFVIWLCLNVTILVVFKKAVPPTNQLFDWLVLVSCFNLTPSFNQVKKPAARVFRGIFRQLSNLKAFERGLPGENQPTKVERSAFKRNFLARVTNILIFVKKLAHIFSHEEWGLGSRNVTNGHSSVHVYKCEQGLCQSTGPNWFIAARSRLSEQILSILSSELHALKCAKIAKWGQNASHSL